MPLWPTDPYRELFQKYERASYFHQAEDFPELYRETKSAIQAAEKLNNWPLITKWDRHGLEANLLYMHAYSMEKLLDNSIENAWKIINVYERSLASLNPKRFDPVFFLCCFAIADLCIRHVVVKQLEFGECAVKYTSQARDMAQRFERGYEYALATARLADAYSISSLSKETLEQAIHFYMEALEMFKEQNLHEEVVTTTSRLSFTFLHPFLSNDSENIEKAISFAHESLINKQVNFSRVEDGHLYSHLARAYSIRPNGLSYVNDDMAALLYEIAFDRLEEIYGTDEWIHIATDWLWFVQGKRDIRALNIAKRLDRIFACTNIRSHPDAWFAGLVVREKLPQSTDGRFKASGGLHQDELKQLVQYIDKETNSRLWWVTQFQIAAQTSLQDLNNIPALIEKYKEILRELCIFPNVDAKYFGMKTEVEIAKCYSRINYWIEADYYFSSAIEGLFRIPESNDMYHGMADSFRDAPIAAIHNKNIARALKLADYLHCRTTAVDLEHLLSIDTQINRHSLFKRYVRLKQGYRILHLVIDERERTEILGKMKEYDDYLKKVLVTSPISHTRSKFYEQFNDCLPKLDSWVLVPLLGNRHSRLILIPPQASVNSIHISEELDFNYFSEHGSLIQDYENGWMASLNRLQRLRHLKGGTPQRRRELGKIRKEFEKIDEHLWNAYCRWMMTKFEEHSATYPLSLCIIASGPLIFFPFAMARNPETGEQLIDIAEISYAPSLYSFYSLYERARLYSDEPSLGSVTGTDDPDLPYLDLEYSLVTRVFSKERRQHLASKDSEVFEKAKKLFSSADHWHVSTHASFGWSDAGHNNMNLGVKPLPADRLSFLAPDGYLRLAVINACESAMHNNLDSDSDPDGFLYQLLKLGAIGAIGNLWGLTDASGAILMGRFYYYYRIEHLTPAAALRCAQCWVRDATVSELSEYIQAQLRDGEENYGGAFLANLEEHLPHEQPFSHPLYWAGYVLLGQ